MIWGMGMSLADVGAQTLLNRLVPSISIGAVTGLVESGKLLFEGCGSLLAPALLAIAGVRGALFIAGGTLPLAVIATRHGFQRIDDRAVARVDVLELLRGVPFFNPLRVDALEGVAARLTIEAHAAGEEIVRQGDSDADRWFLVADGELVVEVDGFRVGVLLRASQFGERALLRDVPRAATVRAVTDVELYSLARDDFLAAVAGPDLQRPLGALGVGDGAPLDPSSALAAAPLVAPLGAGAVAELAEHSRMQELDAGTPIVSEGDLDDDYHVLLSGRAEVIAGGEIRRELHAGDAFGEIAVLKRVPRTATVLAREPVLLLSVSGEAIRAALAAHGGTVAALVSGERA